MKTLLILFLVTGCSHAYTVKQAEIDFCKARAIYKLAAANNPDLSPAPGSSRQKLEAAEDAFCTSIQP